MRDPLIGPLRGVVASRQDPQKRGRVTVRVPGVFEGGSDEEVSPWAEPLNASRGVGRGELDPPEPGAEVTVWPVYDAQIGQGDPDALYYLPGNHGEGDVPDEYTGPGLSVRAYRDYVTVVDERPLEERAGGVTFTVHHRGTEDGYSHDAETLATSVSGTASMAVTSNSRVDVLSPAAYVNGRLVDVTRVSSPSTPPDTSITIRVPGGVVLRPTVTTPSPSKFTVAMALMNQVGTALAPIKPVLSIVKFVRALFDWVKAIPAVLSVPPDLDGLRDATNRLGVAGADVLALEPTAAFVPFVLDVINAARALVEGLEEQLAEIDAITARAAAVRAAADEDTVTDAARAAMEAVADELDAAANNAAASISSVLEPVDSIFAAINDIGSVFGTNLLPRFGTAAGVEALRDVVAALKRALDNLPS